MARNTNYVTANHNEDSDRLTAFPLFDWLRFALASIVVLYHAGAEFASFLTGALAVQVFFALSGWLIGGILLRTGKNELPRFFFNRATRIWIPYALAIALLYTLAALKEGIDFFWFKYLILDVTFTHQLFTIFPAAAAEMPLDGSGNQFWSISVEEQFYLLAPLILLFVRWGKSLWLWGTLAIVTTIFGWNSASIAWGVSAAIAQMWTGFISWRSTRLIAISLSAIFAVLLAFLDSNRYFGPLFAIAVVIAVATPGRRNQVALVAGGLSYPLYLNHYLGVFIVNFFSKRYLPIGETTFVVAQYVLNVAIALGLYWLVDRYILIHRNKWYSRKLGVTLGATAYGLVGSGLVVGTLLHFYGRHG